MIAILVDDEPDGIKTLEKLIKRHCPEVHVAGTCSNASAARTMITDIKPDVVFLDIQMPGTTGLELLAQLTPKAFEVVFVTAYNQYMLQALQYSAVDYLLKPVDEDRLIEAVQRVSMRIKEGRQDEKIGALLHNISKTGNPLEMRLCLPTQKGFMVLRLEEIIYCRAERSYTEFILIGNKTVLVSRPLADYDELLKDTSFLRVHKSYLINLHHVREYQRGEGGLVVLSNSDEIEVSRRRKDVFLSKIRESFRG